MKAVFVISPLEPNHRGVRAEREARALETAGWQTAWIRWTRIGIPPTGLLQRARAYLDVCKTIVSEIVDEGADIIVAHDIEMLRPSVIAGRKFGVPVFYNAHEDWPKLIARNSAIESVVARIVEWWYGRQVAHVLAVNETVARRFPKATVFYNARYSDEIHLTDREESRKALGYAPDDFVFGYVGAIGQMDGFSSMLNKLASKPFVKVLLVVRTDDIIFTGKFGENVQLIVGVPPNELGKYYAAMDAGLILLHKDDAHDRTALPNKLFEYMAYGVPVIAPAFAKEVAKIIRATGCGLVLSDYCPEVIARLPSAGEAGRKAFLETYSWDKQAPKFLSVVNDAVRK